MRFSIIIPVLNEEAVLEAQLTSLMEQCTSSDCELLIVDGGSSDSTVAIAQRYGRVICAPRGRASQMNAGAAVANGDIFIFLHADTRLPTHALQAIDSVLKKPEVIGGAFRIKFDEMSLAYLAVAWTTNLRSRLFHIFTGDQAYFMRATSFRAINGYPEQPLMEDLAIISRLRSIGRFILMPQYVITSARRHQKIGLLRSVLFMWYLRMLYRFGTSPTRLQQMYSDIR